jgi:hypothetical protein
MSFLTQLWETIKSLILKLQKPVDRSLRKGDIYHIREGTHRNKFILFIDTHAGDLNFLLLPEAKNITIKKPDLTLGTDRGIISYIENVPRSTYNTCYKQFNHNETTSSRR